MRDHDGTRLKFYPTYCWPKSPTCHIFVKITATNLLALEKHSEFRGQKTLFYLNHPVRWVQIVGIVVSLDHFEHLWKFHVDDGSGALAEVVMDREKPTKEAGPGELIQATTKSCIGRSKLGSVVDFQKLSLGHLVKVKGSVQEFRGANQLSLERMTILHNTTAEAQFWLELATFHTSTLSRPWILTANEQEELFAQDMEAKRVLLENRKLKEQRDKKRAQKLVRAHARETREKTKNVSSRFEVRGAEE